MDTSKVIRGVVNSGRYTVTAPIVKEDYGLYLQIEGVELPQTYEVDFSNSEHSGTSVTMIGNSDGVLIPHQFIDTGKDVFAFLYHVGEDFGRTVYKFRIPNKVRPDRTDETPTPEEQSVIDQAIGALNDAVAQTAQDVIDADASAQAAKDDADRAEQAKDDAQTFAQRSANSAQASADYSSSAQTSASASAQSASQSAQIKADVEELVDDAQASADASEQSASNAHTYATGAEQSSVNASASAQSASQYASQAQSSAQTASAKAQDASGYAQTASQKATEASQSASQASGYAQTAESAKTDAQTAQGLAEQAQTGAETAQGKAEDAQEAAESVAESIPSDYSQLSEDVSDLKEGFRSLSNTPFDKFYAHISNPLVKTSIKMVGDSITAGLGGTGYSATDETIIGSSQKTNVKTAICWANMFYHYLMDNFAGDKIIEANDSKITTTGMYQINMNVMIGSQHVTYHSEYTANSVAAKNIEFDMYGTEFSIIYSKASVYGIFDVYVDGVLNTSVDCYASSTSHGVSITIDGLTEDTHTIAIYSTNAKNDASTGKQFYIHGFVIPKTIEWHNYGISGTSVNSGINENGRYSVDDDFVFIMYGTNNRVTTATYKGFITEYKQLYDLLVDTYGINPIIISPPPAAEAQDTTNANTTYMFHTYDLQMAIREIADYYKVPFIDVYNGFLEYADNHDITYTTLLVDGLHPNNNGYNVIYHKVIKALGLPLMPSYKEWYQPT